MVSIQAYRAPQQILPFIPAHSDAHPQPAYPLPPPHKRLGLAMLANYQFFNCNITVSFESVYGKHVEGVPCQVKTGKTKCGWKGGRMLPIQFSGKAGSVGNWMMVQQPAMRQPQHQWWWRVQKTSLCSLFSYYENTLQGDNDIELVARKGYIWPAERRHSVMPCTQLITKYMHILHKLNKKTHLLPGCLICHLIFLHLLITIISFPSPSFWSLFSCMVSTCLTNFCASLWQLSTI